MVVMVMLDGAIKSDKVVFVSFKAVYKLFPQEVVNKTFTLSPVAATLFEVYFILTIREPKVPESIAAFNPNVPTNDHK